MLDYSLKILTEPASEPVTTTEAKAHLVVEHTSDDTLIATLITAARKHVEARTNRALVRQKWRLYRDSFADSMDLHKQPVISIDSVNYVDTDGVAHTVGDDTSPVDGSAYYELDSSNGYVLKVYGATYPPPRNQTNAVWVDFWTGYADTSASPQGTVPADLRIAILLLVEHMYEHRGASSEIQLFTNPTFDLLLQAYWMPV